jgi:hypothetical protein
MDYSEGS